MPISGMEIACFGHVLLRQVASHAIPTQSPHPKGWMMTGKDGVRQIVEASLTGLAPVTLTLRLRIVAPLFGHLSTVTRGTTDPVWPTQGSDGLKAFGVVDTRLHGYHGASIAQEARENKRPLKAEPHLLR